MAYHIHTVSDTDIPCKVDALNRSISIPSGKTLLVQGDHRSEKYTFLVPQTIDDHIMMQCNSVRVIFSNVGTKEGELSEGVYDVKDLAFRDDDDNPSCTWEIEKPATMYAGKLHFSLEFRCLDKDGNITYEWNTDTNKEITVLSKNDPVASVTEKYPDSLAQFEEFLAAGGNITVDENLSATSENPVQNKAISQKFSQVETAALTTANAAIDARNIATQAKKAVDDVIDLTNGLNDDIGTLLNDVDGLKNDVYDAMSELRHVDEGVDGITDLVDAIDTRVTALEQNGTGGGGKLDVHDVEGYAFAVGDESGNIAFGVRDNGKVVFDKGDYETYETDEYAYAVCDNNGNVVFAITHDGEVDYSGKGIGGGGSTGYFNYKQCGLPVLYLQEQEAGAHKAMIEAAKPANNYEKLEKSFDYTLKTAKGTTISSGTCDLKFQGSSSLRNQYPKYNYTLKAKKGLEFEATGAWPTDNERVIKKFDHPWGAQRKYCMKANFIDPSGARNVASARLWASIVASRAESDVVDPADARLTATPNCGAVDGFPVIIELNGEFRGLYTFNIPKEDWMFNGINGEGDIKYIVGGESNDEPAAGFDAIAVFPEDVAQNKTDFAIEYQPDDTTKEDVVNSFNEAISAVMDAKVQLAQNPDYDWEAAVSPYFDIASAIDYYIFTCCISGADNTRKNILYATYGSTEEGVPDKWFMSAYDLDTTFGSNPYGKGLYKVKTSNTQFLEASNRHNLFYLIYHYSHDKLMNRYNELRSDILSDANVWYVFNNFVNAIPKAVYNADADRWASANIVRTMPATTTANVENYMQYYRMHCALLDKEMEE